MPPSEVNLNVVLVNPLGAALDHYTASLEHILAECGATVVVLTLMEPSSHGQSRTRWIYEYVRLLWKLRKSRSKTSAHSLVIQVWPAVGYWDFILLRCLLGRMRSLIIFHDPHPLVRAVGYGRIARWVASRSLIKAGTIVHSAPAAHIVRSETTIRDIETLNHPMLSPERPVRQHTCISVRVLGQYKTDRDIEGMKRLAVQGPAEWTYEVIGRGWPSIEGWNVVDKFITEDEFDQYLRASTVIVIPYIRFFQSGVAIRSLEVGTPVVGPHASSLADLIGDKSGWLITGDTWLSAVEAAIYSNSDDIYQISLNAYHRVLEKWRAWSETNITTLI